MVNTTNIEGLKKKLKNIFCASNDEPRRYSEVWLSEADFGGLYKSDKFILHVKAEHDIDSCNDEIKNITNELFAKLTKEEFSLIWRIIVYNSSEEMHCASDELLVFNEAEACK